MAETRRRPGLLTEAADRLISSTFQTFAEWLRGAAGQELDEGQASTIATLALGSLLSSRLLPSVIGVNSMGVDDDSLVSAWVDMVGSMLRAC